MRRDLQVAFRPGAEPMQQARLGELQLPGVDGSYVSTPHVAALAIADELDVRVDLTHPRWFGDRQLSGWSGDQSASAPLAAKRVTAGDQWSWLFYLRFNGTLRFAVSTDGSSGVFFGSDQSPYVRAGGRTVVRVTYESDDGSGDARARFYQGWSLAGPWVLISEQVETGPLPLFDATGAPLEIGSFDEGSPTGTFRAEAMTVHAVQVRDGIDGTVVADPVFDGHPEGETLFTDAAGRDWTVHGDAHITADVPVPAWVDITADVQSADWRVGRERDDEDWPPGEATLLLRNELRQYDPENETGPLFGLLEPRTPFRLRAPLDGISALSLPEARTFLDHPGAAGDNAVTPASSSIGITGDIDLRVRARLDDWAPGTSQRLLSRGGLASDGDFSWRWSVGASGIVFQWSPNGAATATATSSVPLVFDAGSEHWVRVTFRANDGFGRHEVRFWASQDGQDWVEVGSPQTGTGNNRLWGGSRPLATGRLGASGNNLEGEVLQLEVRDGIGGRRVANPDFTRQPPGATELTDSHGNVWSIDGATSITLDAATRSWVSTPHHADFNFAGNIDIRVDATLEGWRPGTDVVLASKWEETGNERSWIFALRSTGHLVGIHSTDGATEIVRESTAPVVPGPGGRLTVRALLVPDFFGSSLWTFHTGTEGVDGATTQLGDAVEIDTSPTTLNASVAPVEIGSFNDGASSDPFRQLSGLVHAARIGDGSIAGDPDFTTDAAGELSVTDSTGKIWTLTGDADLIQDPATVGDQFYGFVEDGFEQTWHDPADGYCTVTLTDLFGLLPGMVLPGVFEGAVTDVAPTAYWRLNEAIGRTGEEVSDQSERQHTGRIIGGGITFGENPLAAGLGDAATFDKGDQDDQVARIDITRARIGRDPYNEAVLAMFATSTRPPAQNFIDRDFILDDTDGNAFNAAHAADFWLAVNDDGRLRVQAARSGFGGDAVIGPVVDDGEPHLTFAQRAPFSVNDGIGVDSAVVHQDVTEGGISSRGVGAAIGGMSNAAGAHTDNQFTGTLQHVAVWDRALTQADRDHIYEALTGLAGRRSDEQLRWALHQIGVPNELLDLDEGVTRMAAADSGGKDVLDFARELDATEGGAFHVDHHNGGKLRFRSRYTRWLADRSRIAQETFTDDPAAVEAVRAERDALVIQPKGVSTVTNTWTVTWAGGEETATDEPSRRKYGARGDQIDTQAPTSAFARGLARWMLSLTKEPRTLVRGLGIDPAAAEAGWPAAVGLQIWDRASFRHQPLATGSITERSLQIEGGSHQVEGMTRTSQFHTSTAADAHQQLFLADTSETDGAHVAAP